MQNNLGFRALRVWQMAMDFVVVCYEHTAGFPEHERYGLTGQIRRAAISVPSHLAEGHCRRRTKVFLNHVSIALGSNGELSTCFEVALRLNYLPASVCEELREAGDAIGKSLSRLHDALEAPLPKPRSRRQGSNSDVKSRANSQRPKTNGR